MPDEKLILYPGSGLAHVGTQGGRIVAEMLGGALELARAAQNGVALVPRFRIGEHVFCEPEYQQILLWAKALDLEPEAVLERLLNSPRTSAQEYKTSLANGRIVTLGWDLGLLPLVNFEWVDGLVIEDLGFFVPEGYEPVERSLALPLPKLRHLLCSDMGLILLDLSAATQLENIFCCGNPLTELDLSAVSQLKVLLCYNNRIASLDLTQVPQLTVLFCSQNRLTEVDLSSVPQLTGLWCHHNQITKLDLSAVPQLTKLCCFQNRLTELDLSAVPQLTGLWCENNQITELDIRPLVNFEKLKYDTAKARVIQRPDQNFSTADTLARTADAGAALVPRFRIGEHLFCEPDYHQILLWVKALELEPEMVVERLLTLSERYDQEKKTQIEDGRIVKLGWDLGSLPMKSFEWVDGLVIEAITFLVPERAVPVARTLSLRLPVLRRLSCVGMGLICLDLSSMPQLAELECGWNKIASLDLSAVPQLTDLNCNLNDLSELDLAAVPLLSKLDCGRNHIAELDLSTVPLLSKLDCVGNQIAELDLSEVPQLTWLWCFGNHISMLDVRACEKLKELSCDTAKTRLIQRPDQHF